MVRPASMTYCCTRISATRRGGGSGASADSARATAGMCAAAAAKGADVTAKSNTGGMWQPGGAAGVCGTSRVGVSSQSAMAGVNAGRGRRRHLGAQRAGVTPNVRVTFAAFGQFFSALRTRADTAMSESFTRNGRGDKAADASPRPFECVSGLRQP